MTLNTLLELKISISLCTDLISTDHLFICLVKLQDYLLALCKHLGAAIVQHQIHTNVSLPLYARQLNDWSSTFSQFLHIFDNGYSVLITNNSSINEY